MLEQNDQKGRQVDSVERREPHMRLQNLWVLRAVVWMLRAVVWKHWALNGNAHIMKAVVRKCGYVREIK